MPDTLSILVKVRRRLNYLRRDIGWQLGLDESFFNHTPGARILLYHGVCRYDPLRFNTLFVDLKTFEMHLRFYSKYFNVVSLDDFYAQRFSNDKFTICLTFDDGMANNYKYVLPLLQQYGMPATFFVTGIRDAGYDILWNDFLSIAAYYGPQKLGYKNEAYSLNSNCKYVADTNGKPLADLLRSTDFNAKKEMMETFSSLAGFKQNPEEEDYWKQLTEAQIRTLAGAQGISIGCHGYYHNDLAQLPPDEATTEMVKSKKYLENITGKEIKAIAFPYGSYTSEVKDAARRTGFSQLLATAFLYNSDTKDASMRERLTINPFISTINQMHACINGHYE